MGVCVHSQYLRGQCRPSKGVVIEHLLRVAGDLPRHIAMVPRGDRKYIERPNKQYPAPAPVTQVMLRRHLEGRITLGSWLANQDGLTWAVIWDADDAERWGILLRAGRRLLATGAEPIAERSPARGEHAGGGTCHREGQLRLDVGVGPTPDAVGPEQATHERTGQRLEY